MIINLCYVTVFESGIPLLKHTLYKKGQIVDTD